MNEDSTFFNGAPFVTGKTVKKVYEVNVGEFIFVFDDWSEFRITKDDEDNPMLFGVLKGSMKDLIDSKIMKAGFSTKFIGETVEHSLWLLTDGNREVLMSWWNNNSGVNENPPRLTFEMIPAERGA